jgi:hypothetical protein
MSKDGMSYESTGGKSPKVKVNILEQTSTGKIISHLMYRHRVGLLTSVAVWSTGYIIYDKFISLFI